MKFNRTARKELWNWLADNPEKGKYEWTCWVEITAEQKENLNYNENREGVEAK